MLGSKTRVNGVAPLEIITRPGLDYFVKLCPADDPERVVVAYIRGGDRLETLLLVGNYTIKYAAGRDWYGDKLDFGLGAVYSQCDEVFEFQRTSGGYTGYTIELILQSDGNLETVPLTWESF